MHKTDRQTISDFGDQWQHYTDNSGRYGSLDLLADIVEPLVLLAEIAGKNVAEIGAGTGRTVAMLCAAGAAHVTAIESSDSFAVLLDNTRKHGDRITCIQVTGDQLPPGNFDIVFFDRRDPRHRRSTADAVGCAPVVSLIAEAGFADIRARRFSYGLNRLYTATK
jgi:Methyltransferase domain